MKKLFWLITIVIFLFGCDFDSGKLERIEVTGPVVTANFDLAPFSTVLIAGPIDVVLDQNNGSAAEVETYESMMDLFRAEVIDDILVLYVLDTTSSVKFNVDSDLEEISKYALLSGSMIKWPENRKLLTVNLSLSEVENFQIIGECSIKTAKPFKAEKVHFEVAGAMHLDAEMFVDSFHAEVAGASNLELRGAAKDFHVEYAGAGSIKAYDFISDHVKLDIAGACNAGVYAKESIEVNIAGVGTVKYKGNPGEVNFDKAGIGSLKQVESDEKEIEL